MKKVQKFKTVAILYAALSLCGFASCSYDQIDSGAHRETPGTSDRPGLKETERSILGLEILDSTNDVYTIGLNFNLGIEKAAPRLMEAHLKLSDNLDFVDFDKGNAALVAQKEVVVQQKEPNLLRVMVFASSNANTLDSGRIATVKLKKRSNAAGKVEILTRGPIFAPGDANSSLLLGEPLTL